MKSVGNLIGENRMKIIANARLVLKML